MGICNSSESISVSTIQLIHPDGRLQEFTHSIRASHVLQKYPGCFVCNADELEFDNFVTAIHADEALHPGQLYFILPLTRLKYPIQAEEMAALAVRASSALRKNGVVVPVSDKKLHPLPPRVDSATVGGGGGGGVGKKVVVKRRSKSWGGGKGSGRNFTTMLSAIEE